MKIKPFRLLRGHRSVFPAVLVIVAVLSGCTLHRGRHDDVRRQPLVGPESALRERATTLWAAKESEDWSTVFRFQDPQERDDSKEAAFAEWSAANEPFVVNSHRIGKVIASGGFGWVEVDSSVSMRRFPDTPARDVHRWEKWCLVDGNWFPVSTDKLDDYPESPAERNLAEEERLRKRFDSAWDARVHADWPRLYAMTDPSDHGAVPEPEFAKGMSMLDFLECDVRWLQVIGDRGKVHVEVIHKLTDPSLTKLPARSVVIDEPWVLVDGEWYLDLKVD